MSNSFQKLPTTKKGVVGEAVAYKVLRTDYHVYPVLGAGSHPCDLMLIKQGTTKPLLADVKAKECFCDSFMQGIDIPDYIKYLKLSQTNDFHLYFVDPVLGEIWTGRLQDLYRTNTTELVGIKFYDPERTTRHYELTMNDINLLRPLVQRTTLIEEYEELIERADKLLPDRPNIGKWTDGTSYMFQKLKAIQTEKPIAVAAHKRRLRKAGLI